jgi:hypothetical protein
MPVIMPCAGDVCTHCRVVRAVKQKAKLVLRVLVGTVFAAVCSPVLIPGLFFVGLLWLMNGLFSFVLKGEWEHLN